MSQTRITMMMASLAALVGCADDPLYIQPAMTIEANADGMGTPGMGTLTLPIRTELSDEELDDRAQLAMDLGVTDADIPFAPRDDLAISIEWSVENLGDVDGTMRIDLNGASEYVAYVPALF